MSACFPLQLCADLLTWPADSHYRKKMRRLSLKSVLALSFAMLALLLSLILVLVLEKAASRQVSNDIGRDLHELAFQISNKLDTGMQERYADIHILAALEQVRNPATSQPVNRALLESLQANFADYAWIGFADVQGKVVYATGGLLQGMSVSARPWFQQGLNGSFVGDVHDAKLLASKMPREANGDPLRFVDVAVPVFDQQKKLIGVLGAHMAWRWSRSVADSTLLQARRHGNVEAFVINQQGHVLLAPDGKHGVELPDLAALGGQGWGRLAWADGEYLTGVSSTKGYLDYPGLGWRVVLRQPAAEAFAPVTALQGELLLAGLVCALLFAAVGVVLAIRISRPLRDLAAAADALHADEQQLSLPPARGYHEARQLRDSMQMLLQRVDAERGKLASLNHSLEDKVAERTAQLQHANRELADSLEERQGMVRMLDRLAYRDSLTDVLNRRAFYLQAPPLLQGLAADGQRAAVLLLDVDHFKSINDQYGHDAGDAALQSLAKSCQAVVPADALLARFGGEEFVILLPAANLPLALSCAEQLRAAIENTPVNLSERQIRMTASIGVCLCGDVEGLAQALSLADEALYKAKQDGRNRVRAAANV